MSEAFRFDYYYGAESDQFSFVRIPKLLLKDPKFANLSHGAIITYAVLLDRMNLSIKNGWHDEYNRVYIRYKVTDLTDVIGKSDDTVSKYLKELEDIDYRSTFACVCALYEEKIIPSVLDEPNALVVSKYPDVSRLFDR